MTSRARHAFAFAGAQLLALPGFGMALFLYIVGRVTGSGGWLQGVFELLFSGVVLLPVVLLCAVLLLIAGLFSSVRPWACLVLLLVNVAVLVVAGMLNPATDVAEWVIWVLTALSAAAAATLAWQAFSLATWPGRNMLRGLILLVVAVGLGLGLALGLAGGGGAPVSTLTEQEQALAAVPPESVFDGLLGGTPTRLTVHDCKVYRALPGKDAWEKVLEPDMYPFYTVCDRQSLQVEEGAVTVTLGRMAFGAGGCCATGGTYRSTDGALWKKL
ncbi:hypothetical protein [Polaromonas sp.]|uniref:hypothetical protein n=1 Tax=Polaromonas sp. TaxID=1869339 RepID=UPI003265F20E